MSSSITSKPAVRLLLTIVGIAICVWTIRSITLFGMSRMFVRYSQATGNAWTAQKAIEMTPLDADTYRTRAAITQAQSPPEAAMQLEHAISLRPSDYLLWIELGLARDQMGDTAGALAAFNEAVKRAPFYAMPYWQRGNLQLRMGQFDAAFTDLNQAAQSNPDLIPSFIDLAWSLSKNDASATSKLVRVDTKSAHTALAKFFASHGKPEEAMRQLEAAGAVNEDTRRELIENLIQRESYAEAYRVWSVNLSPGGSHPAGGIFDGGFESTLSFDEGGFSWRIPRQLQAVRISLDSTEPHSGQKNLRIEFEGNSTPEKNIAAQLVLVEPSSRYQLNFAARSQDIVSGGLPIIVVSDAGPGRKVFGKSAPLAKGTTAWTVASFDFTTGPNTHAVVLSVQREACTSAPCPIFGAISLDSFSLALVK